MAGNDNGIPSVADIIVVGSGSAGAVVARRLVDAGATVVVVEAGGPDANPAIHEPSRLFELWDSEQDWGYRTVPQGACAGRELHWPRGKVLGGSSALNGMIYARGHRSDYDTWAYLGNEGWGYEDVLPLFKRSEDFDQGESAFHGSGGPLHVLSRYEPHPVNAAVVAAAQEAGIPFNDDYNGEQLDGVSFCQLNVRDGRRQTGATAFLAPLAGSPGLTVLTGACAQRLLFEGARCVGVEIARDGVLEQIRAEREVIVCAGTVESPKLLLLSGIGAADELAPPRDRRRRRSPGRRAQPARPRALAGHLRGVAGGSTRRAGPPAAAQPPLLAQPARASGARHPAALLPSAALPRGHGGAGRRLHADGRDHPSGEPRLAAARLRRPVRVAAHRPGLPSCEVDLDALVAAIELCREIGGQGALGDVAGQRALSGAGRADAGRAARVRPRHRDHLPPPGGDLQDGRGRPTRSSTRSCASAASTDCASPTPRSCRSSARATRTPLRR